MSQDRSRSSTPFSGLLNLTQQLTPRKTPRMARRITLDIQSLVNDAGESHTAVKRKLADVTNQLDTNHQQPTKRRHRGNRAAEAPEDVDNPNTLEDRVRKAGRHFVIERGLFLFTDIHTLLDTAEDPNFSEDTEFDSDDSRIQGQLRDVLDLLPADAKEIRKQEWIGAAFADGMVSQTAMIGNRLRRGSLALLAKLIKFSDGEGADFDDFNSSASRFNAFSKRIGYQAATDDAAEFYSMLKAEVLYEDYDPQEEMDVNKIFRGRLLLLIYACIIRGPNGAKDIFEGTSSKPKGTTSLPGANVIQRIHKIKRTTPAAIASDAVWAIWLLSSDTQFSSGGEGDETGIDYKFYYQTFMRQICDGVRDQANWALHLFRYWDAVLFPNADDSLSNAPAANHQAVGSDVDAMDAAFRAATQRREPSTEQGPSPSSPSPSQSSQGDSSQSGPSYRSPRRATGATSRSRRR
ncbi:hypothetical protein GGX14DRAFT_565020 [Mycena pura]|uniref:Uncharacterized protein n=1 Tax=Mycena pura TaxID=153505 RepID=A0AAD6VJ14_9AGAR|nr:hypothetical protein GGX14DRAFT_565020 [Mycena pura]